MDAKKFGAFVAAVRKEKGMTQLELANRLLVTDKAVSKWERGLGFPDINTIEPLAEALGVTVAELMASRRLPDAGLDTDAQLAKWAEMLRKRSKKSAVAWSVISIMLSAILLAAKAKVDAPDGLVIGLILVILGIPRIIRARNDHQGSAEDKKKFNKIFVRSLLLSILIVFCIVVATVIYAIYIG